MPFQAKTILHIARSALLLISIYFLLPTSAGAAVIIQAPLYIGLSNGLVGNWSFDGPTVSGTDPLKVNDLSGQGNQGSASGSNIPKRVAGQISQALSFDGSNDYVAVGTMPSFSANPNFGTVSIWFKTTSTAVQHLVGTLNTVANDAMYRAVINFDPTTGANDPGEMQFTLRSSGFNSFAFGINTNTGITDGNWHHLVFVHEKSNDVFGIYLDGVAQSVLDVSTLTGTTFIQWDNPLLIGAMNSQGTPINFFNGSIDDVRIYNRALTETEIKRLHNIGAGSKIGVTRTIIESGLVGHWTFDGPDIYGSSALDKSGQGNNGTLTNGPTPIKGRIGQGMEFDGEDAYVAIGNAGSGIQTVSFWMYAHDTTTRDIIDLDGTDQIQLNGSSQIVATDFPAATVYVDGQIGNSVTPNTWHHILITDTTGVNATALEIGRVTTSNEFDGILDDVRLYNRVLSPDELQRLYIGTKPTNMNVTTSAGSLGVGLVGHWSFDGKVTGPTWTDDVSGSGNSGTLTNGPQPTRGIRGQALDFDGEAAYVAVGNAGGGIQTISFWMNARDTTTRDIIDLDGTDQIQLNGGSQIVATDFPAATIYVDGEAGSTVTPNTWHHILVTDTVGVNATALEIGRVTTSNEFDGILDDVRLYNRVLTPHEIQRLSAMGGR